MQFPIIKIFNSCRKKRCYLLLIITLMFLFLISVNYSVYVKTKAYEIYIRFDKSSINSELLSNTEDNLKIESKCTTVIREVSTKKISVYIHSNASALCPLLPQHLNKSK
jgi:hypothetical protein